MRDFSRKVYYFFRRISVAPLLLLGCFLDKRKNKRILVVLASKIGDFIIFSPSLRYIKEAYPGYSLSVITHKNAYALAEAFPEIDEFIPLDTKRFQFNPLYAAKTFWQLRKKGFPVVLYPAYSRSFTGDELVHMAGAKESVGFAGDASNLDDYNRGRDNKWFTKVLKPDPDFERGFSEVDRYRYFCEQLGATIGDDFVPRIAVSSDDATAGMRILKECGWKGGNYVVLAPGAGLRYRSWPTSQFAKVVEYFIRDDFEVVFSGSAAEQDLYDAISGNLPEGALINLMGKTNLLQLGGVLQHSVMYFGSDTGTVHLAAAVGAPTVCLMGGGHFGRFFPYGDLKKNRIVYDKHMTCKYDDWACARTVPPGQPAPCIAGITVDDAIAEAKDILTYIHKK